MNSKLSNKYALLSHCTILLVLTASAAGQAGQLDRIERPARQRRHRGNHAVSLGLYTRST